LVDYVSSTNGNGLKAALDGLSPSEMGVCWQKFARKLTDTYCIYDRTHGQITVKIEYVPIGKPSRQQAA
jgi:hypothetical protein